MKENTQLLQAADEQWMEYALSLARKAESAGEVPVGAVLVSNGEAVGEGWNRMIGSNDPTAHAEIVALRAAAAKLGNYRLPGVTLYVTLEPCCMCSGAIIHARLERVVYAANDPKTGACGSRFDILTSSEHNHSCEVSGGCLAAESAELLKAFFRERRKA